MHPFKPKYLRVAFRASHSFKLRIQRAAELLAVEKQMPVTPTLFVKIAIEEKLKQIESK